MKKARIRIEGVVQGVGFRPFVHRTVSDFGLKGYIKNTSSGVELELEGEEETLRRFVRELPARAPSLAVIERVTAEYSDVLSGFEDFRILESRTEQTRNTLISPDICICDDCLREFRTKGDRRYRYPFINCTNCGPRFTIIRDVPYDRAKTSMSEFEMCPECAREYADINDRRYHAQPDCCPECGPELFFLDCDGKEISGDASEHAREYLKQGKIVAVKGLGGMHLACLAEREDSVNELRRRKHRDEKPFALMCRDTECAEKLCLVNENERRILESPERPIVLLKKREKGLSYISENAYIGVMLPYTPLHYLLMGEDIDALVMTSANLSDTPIMYKNDEAVEKLHGIADGFLLHNREIVTRCDDSLCWVLDGHEYFARRSRGYVPFPIKTDRELMPIIACGAEQKASFALSKGNYVFLSQHIGDLKNIETFDNYVSQTRHFEHMFDILPKTAVCDLHPDYMSTEFAQSLRLPLVRVQHHHAHMASCMADNLLEGRVIGLVWDGTGLGTDGKIWGGECLIGGYKEFERFGSIREIPLIGGDRAAKEIDRVGYALLRESGCETPESDSSAMYERMLSSNINCPYSSGMGRLFDGMAAILGIREKCSYEGQGAVLLEACAVDGENGLYPYALTGTPLRYDWRETVRSAVSERDAGVPTGAVAAKFMNTLIVMACEMCAAAREKSGLDRVVLSGGSFQNMYIMERLPEALRQRGFAVYTHRRVSPNDEGLSLGQLMAADAILREDNLNVPCGSAETNRDKRQYRRR